MRESYATATIQSGQTQSDVVSMPEYMPVAILAPAAFTGTTVGLWVPDATGVFYRINDLSLSIALSCWTTLTYDQSHWLGEQFRMSTTFPQGADREIVVKLRRFN